MELGAKLRKFLPSLDYLLQHQGKERCLNFLRKPSLPSHVSYYYSSYYYSSFEDIPSAYHSAYCLSSPSKSVKPLLSWSMYCILLVGTESILGSFTHQLPPCCKYPFPPIGHYNPQDSLCHPNPCSALIPRLLCYTSDEV